MTQVFAAINHRLSEEYGAIDLPDQEAKGRCVFHWCKNRFILFELKRNVLDCSRMQSIYNRSSLRLRILERQAGCLRPWSRRRAFLGRIRHLPLQGAIR